jgi:CBS domain-containing protein
MKRLPHVSYKSRDRGPLEFKSVLRKETGNIMYIAQRDVLSIAPTTKIKEAAELMVKHEIRRLPVVDAGTGQLRGMVITRDIVDFLGGGEKNKIIQKKFNGNFLAAVNEPVRTIMQEKVVYGDQDMSIAEAAELLSQTGVGGAPVVDERKRVVGMISERDFAKFVPSSTGVQVRERMTEKVITAEPEMQIKEAARRMIARKVRRLPVVRDRELVGIVTTMDILKFFASGRIFDFMTSGEVDEAMSAGVDRVMTRQVVTIEPQADVGEAASLMVNKKFSGLPVLEADELVGIITERDLLELLV